eukprot:8576324-Ditylum_brightwellii.AAC.1
MPAANVVNRHAQFLLGIEEAIRTKDIFKRIPCSIIGQWAANSSGMARAYNVVLEEDGFFAVNARFDAPAVGTANQVITLSIDSSKTDPLVHTLRSFGNVKDVSRQ